MYISRMHRLPTKRLPGPRMNRHIIIATRPPYRREHAQRILRRLLEGGVAVDGADAEEAEGGVVGGEEDGEGVLGGRGSVSP